MQRIDENTYIDDTLVTCAEYQLFIDEMCDQGKYYQPDHWTSYQFPAGQAREPILGVRHADSVAFCEWLTQRENGEWKYRLLTQEEANVFQIKSLGKKLLGFWLNEKYQFAWIGTLPDNPRTLDFVFEDRTFDSRASVLDLARDLTYTIVRGRALDHAVGRALDLNFDRDIGGDLNLNHVIDIVRDRTFARDRALDLNRSLDLHYNYAYDHSLDLDYNHAVEIYIDILTLQERIAGRFPAFEGIRLVKERIR